MWNIPLYAGRLPARRSRSRRGQKPDPPTCRRGRRRGRIVSEGQLLRSVQLSRPEHTSWRLTRLPASCGVSPTTQSNSGNQNNETPRSVARRTRPSADAPRGLKGWVWKGALSNNSTPLPLLIDGRTCIDAHKGMCAHRFDACVMAYAPLQSPRHASWCSGTHLPLSTSYMTTSLTETMMLRGPRAYSGRLDHSRGCEPLRTTTVPTPGDVGSGQHRVPFGSCLWKRGPSRDTGVRSCCGRRLAKVNQLARERRIERVSETFGWLTVALSTSCPWEGAAVRAAVPVPRWLAFGYQIYKHG